MRIPLVMVRKTDLNGDSHRLYSLPRFPSDVYAKHAVTSPFPFSGQTIQPDNVVESSFDRATFEMDPIQRRRAVVIGSRGRC